MDPAIAWLENAARGYQREGELYEVAGVCRAMARLHRMSEGLEGATDHPSMSSQKPTEEQQKSREVTAVLEYVELLRNAARCYRARGLTARGAIHL